MRMIGTVGMTLLTALCAEMVWAQGLIVCPSCGREAKPGETTCAHCGANLPRSREVGEAEKAAPVEPMRDPAAGRKETIIGLADRAVREDVRRMRELAEKQPAVAYYYAANALAVQRLLPPGHFPEKAEKEILNGNKQLLARLQRGWMRCRFCNGKGRVRMTLHKADGTVSAGPMRTCPHCKGSGGWPGPANADSVKMALFQGRREFERQRMMDSGIRLGRVFVPEALADLLNNRQKALVMTGEPVPCPACQLTGRQPCTACKGTGYVRCDYPGCQNGQLVEKKTHERKKIRIDMPNRQVCPKCEGAGKVACAACNGSGSVPCRKCSGSGIAQTCRKCLGEGTQTCSKCKGTGSVKGAPCPECKGEGIILCPTCRGEGYLAR